VAEQGTPAPATRVSDAFENKFPDDYGEFELHGREWDYNDPVAEAQADLLEMSMGILSDQQAAEKRGRDWGDTQDQRAEARKKKQKLELPLVLSNFTRDEKGAAPEPASGMPPPVPPGQQPPPDPKKPEPKPNE
jgi:capsid protein